MHLVLPDSDCTRVMLMAVLFDTNNAALTFDRSTSKRSARHTMPLEKFEGKIAALAPQPLATGYKDAKLVLMTLLPVDERKMIFF